MSKTPRQLQSEQTRQRIIEAATRLFARRGFYGTSIADLAQATGLTKGALYHHFENKDALFFAVVGAVRDTWMKAVARDVLKSEDALTRLAVLFDSHARLVHENETLCLLMNSLVMEMDGVNPTFMAALQDIYADLALFVERIIQKGQAAGQVRSDLDARLIALNIVGILRGSGCSPRLHRMSEDHMGMVATLKQMLLDGLQP